MADVAVRSEVWWLARGSSSHSRQPSFAPSTARPVVTTSFYAVGWHREKSCFVERSQHDLLEPSHHKLYPCDRLVAAAFLRLCARREVLSQFFGGQRKSLDREVYAAHGHLVALSVGGMGHSTSLHFYSPRGQAQEICLHNGMTESFRAYLSSVPVGDIYQQMQ
jgi:hypothetical protein